MRSGGALLKEINADDVTMAPFQGSYSAEKAAALKAHEFDRRGLAGRGMAYERLDQLTVELLGVRQNQYLSNSRIQRSFTAHVRLRQSGSYHLFVVGSRPQGENRQHENGKYCCQAGYTDLLMRTASLMRRYWRQNIKQANVMRILAYVLRFIQEFSSTRAPLTIKTVPLGDVGSSVYDALRVCVTASISASRAALFWLAPKAFD